MTYHSKFGGLWIDDIDYPAVSARLATIADHVTRERVGLFIRDGYVIIEQAVDHAAIDAYLREYEAAADAPSMLQIEVPLAGGRQPFSREKSRIPGSKVLDTGMLTRHGRDLCFAPEVAEFLTTVFGEKALAFQTLHFEVGSTQAIHQDTAYVVVKDEPLKLVASWIALQDVKPGSGELIYYIGGHRIPDYPYAGGKSKHWNVERDGGSVHDEHLRYLADQASARQLPLGRFMPRKGDVLFWHADLPHGGSAITESGSPRRSLVTHYCPISCMPHYADFIPAEGRIRTPARDGNAFISLYFAPSQLWRGE
jgi:ectoine hydroxylase-related dioxygenase (phytanoyl-CoA dioxygenase family)